MTALNIKQEKWDDAKANAIKAAELQPFCLTTLFRLSACYEREQNYIETHLHYYRAVTLLPTSERSPYDVKLARLQEQSEEMREGVSRKDPFNILPLEIILNVMRFGLQSDPDFGLKASWVSQRWNTTINQNCPELFRTITLSGSLLKKKCWMEKQDTWLQRGNYRMETMVFKDFTMGAIDKLAGKLVYVPGVKTLEIGVKAARVLERLDKHFTQIPDGVWSGIEVLRITDGGRFSRQDPPDDIPLTMTCGMHLDIDKLREISLHWFDFRDLRVYWQSSIVDLRSSRLVDEPVVLEYPALRSLSVHSCPFDKIHAISRESGSSLDPEDSSQGIKYRADQLHTALRGSKDLEHLSVRTYSIESDVARKGMGRKIVLSNLISAILPTPAIDTIDILAPNLQHLEYVLPYWFNEKRYLDGPRQRPPMIPLFEHSPVTAEALSNLLSLKLLCYDRDTATRLELWISRLENVSKLAIRHAVKGPYPNSTDDLPDVRASTLTLQCLHDNPDWCPALRQLEFTSCFTPGKMLVDYCRLRASRPNLAAIEELSLESCCALSTAAKSVLQEEIPQFSCKAEVKVPSKLGRRDRFMNDNFEAPGMEGTE